MFFQFRRKLKELKERITNLENLVGLTERQNKILTAHVKCLTDQVHMERQLCDKMIVRNSTLEKLYTKLEKDSENLRTENETLKAEIELQKRIYITKHLN